MPGANGVDHVALLDVRLRQVNDVQAGHRLTAETGHAHYTGPQALAQTGVSVRIAHNGNNSMPYPYLMDLRVARETGYDGVLVVGDKLRRYLAEGFSVEQAVA